jgi:hypothetical protein
LGGLGSLLGGLGGRLAHLRGGIAGIGFGLLSGLLELFGGFGDGLSCWGLLKAIFMAGNALELMGSFFGGSAKEGGLIGLGSELGFAGLSGVAAYVGEGFLHGGVSGKFLFEKG